MYRLMFKKEISLFSITFIIINNDRCIILDPWNKTKKNYATETENKKHSQTDEQVCSRVK